MTELVQPPRPGQGAAPSGPRRGRATLGWVVARRLATGSDRLRQLWLADPFALDRLVIGAVVVAVNVDAVCRRL